MYLTVPAEINGVLRRVLYPPPYLLYELANMSPLREGQREPCENAEGMAFGEFKQASKLPIKLGEFGIAKA